MKTILVSVPDDDKDLLLSLFKKFQFKSRVLNDEEKEEMAMAKWIREGEKTKEVSRGAVVATLKKHGVKI